MTKHTIHRPAEADELTLSWLSEMELIRKAHRARSEAISGWLGKAGKAIGRRFRTYFQRGRERQRIMNELYSLDDRSLSDLGITRGDIPFVANRKSRIHSPHNDNGAQAA